jgi:hypothetical protein
MGAALLRISLGGLALVGLGALSALEVPVAAWAACAAGWVLAHRLSAAPSNHDAMEVDDDG